LQARTLLQRREEIEAVWLACLNLVEKHGLAERCTAALIDAAYGFRVRRSSYQHAANLSWAEEVPDVTASRDLKAMVQKGLLLPVGERRSRHYLASDELKAIREEIRSRRAPREERDPFNIVRNEEQLSFPAA
jgi:hypothetical protein